ncbi:MAG TPA: alkaline phosphatase family protein [Isosphaeraceae bacterium]|nr:alkaline phosphatase family protein [Isosphaeraceae bacterium]
MSKTARVRLLYLAVVLLLFAPAPAHAYIGPGAGFALAGSFFAVFAAIFSAFLTILTWPIRLVTRSLFGLRALRRSRVKRVVILGLDGMDHGLTETMLEEGKLPNLAALRDRGCFRPLGSTVPPISPVAWSSFQIGVNPGKHNIFDFLTPDLRTYAAKLSSVEIRPPRQSIRIGKYQIPLGKADVRLLRKSQPFWGILSKYGIFSCVLRVPITFPPEKLRGVLLSAMCVPDLRGTQGMFSFYTTRTRNEGEKIGGEVHHVTRDGDTVRAQLIGPADPFGGPETLKVPFTVTIKGDDRATLKIDGAKYELKKDVYTEWVRFRFNAAPGVKVSGLAKFLLLGGGPEFGLYVTPINIDPEYPAMPVGYPSVYSIYLAKKQGPYATLGLAEDTWALNEHVIGDDHFIQQCLDMDNEREAMWFDALERVPRGLVCCVFDGTDRLQHTFWRDIDERHPARPDEATVNSRHVIEDLYRRMDDLVGRTVAKCRDQDDLLMVISDHGFGPFRTGVDLNRWLEENGYLVVDDARRHEEHLAGVDWSRTRAFAIGLSGIYINIKDKYSQGIVEPGEEADELREEIKQRLEALVDPADGAGAVKRVYIASRFYKGPYKDNGPDLIPGYQRGYRVSWETAIGKTTEGVFHPNAKAWSGDHCVDPSLVPGILFCNRPIANENPRLMDLAPTVLSLFGAKVPDYMDGKALTVGDAPEQAPKERVGTLAEVG